jgi:hypothetical protein
MDTRQQSKSLPRNSAPDYCGQNRIASGLFEAGFNLFTVVELIGPGNLSEDHPLCLYLYKWPRSSGG